MRSLCFNLPAFHSFLIVTAVGCDLCEYECVYVCVSVRKCASATSALTGVKVAQTSHQGKHHMRCFDWQVNRRSSHQAVTCCIRLKCDMQVRVLNFDIRKPDESWNHVQLALKFSLSVVNFWWDHYSLDVTQEKSSASLLCLFL